MRTDNSYDGGVSDSDDDEDDSYYSSHRLNDR